MTMPSKDYFPLKKGLRLEYAYESNEFSAPARVVLTILRVSGKGAALSAVARMTTALKGQETSTEYKIAKTAKNVNTFDGIIVGGRLELQLPPTPGLKWRDQCELCEIKSVNEKVKTPAGVFTGCVRVDSKIDLEGGGHARRYYAPGVGYVMEEYCTDDIQAHVRLVSLSEATQKDMSAKTVRRSLASRNKMSGCPSREKQK